MCAVFKARGGPAKYYSATFFQTATFVENAEKNGLQQTPPACLRRYESQQQGEEDPCKIINIRSVSGVEN